MSPLPFTYEFASATKRINSHTEYTRALRREIRAARRAERRILRSLPGLTVAETRILERIGTRLSVSKGTKIARSGEVGQEAFVLAKGSLEVRQGSLRLATLRPGALAGETSILNHARRNADVVVTEAAEIVVLTPSELRSVIELIPSLGAQAARRVA
ncbi:cyclic nucleotide-binding protein [Actinobacteria bacterium IMCC26256]|nr:cyclic nucleotide-binding protein [Actinobacteria bacterium IMCC26256]